MKAQKHQSGTADQFVQHVEPHLPHCVQQFPEKQRRPEREERQSRSHVGEDPERFVYRKLVKKDGRLVGILLLGEAGDAQKLIRSMGN